MNTLTMPELYELLTAVTPARYKTTCAAKVSIVELIDAVTTSKAALGAEQAKAASLRSQLTAVNEAFTTMLQMVLNTSYKLNQSIKAMHVMTAAAKEGKRKLDNALATITDLKAWGSMTERG